MMPFAHKIYSLIDLPERTAVRPSSPISVTYSQVKLVT